MLLILLIGVLAGGCYGYRISQTTGTVNGDKIITPYGLASGIIQFKTVTCMGACPALTVNEVRDAANQRPTVNSTK